MWSGTVHFHSKGNLRFLETDRNGNTCDEEKEEEEDGQEEGRNLGQGGA